MRIREPVAAGSFYPAEESACRSAVARLLETAANDAGPLNGAPRGGIAPHAAWEFGGLVVAKVFYTLSSLPAPRVVILISGIHRLRGRQAAMFGAGRWLTPLGGVDVEQRLAERILGHTNLIVDDPYAHEDEYSIEVLLPFVHYVFPETAIVPIIVPSVAHAHEVGEAVGRTLAAYKYSAVVVGTTDLTHYGPRYGFTPRGIGADGNLWAKTENDRRFIDLVLEGECKTLVREAAEHKNACSAGAAAATVAAVRRLGATRGVLLQHTSSSEVTASMGREDPADSVGYAGIVFFGE